MDEKKLRPGDIGYKGETFTTTIHTKNGSYRLRITKDENGNILSVREDKLFLGISKCFIIVTE